MNQFQALLKRIDVSQARLARATGVSTWTMSRMVAHGEWPKTKIRKFTREVKAFLTVHGAKGREIDGIFAERKQVEPPPTRAAKKPRKTVKKNTIKTEDVMLLRNEALSLKAREHFNLARNPFVDELNSADDIFLSPDFRYCREVLWDVAKNGGFCALVGESGSGKSTLREELHERIKRESASIIVIEPYILAMEDTDAKGRVLKSGQIAEAIIRSLNPGAAVSRSLEGRYHQVHDLLKASYRAGNNHLIVIEEAHSLPLATIKHLKRFWELKDGMTRLLSIVLIGQSELKAILTAHNPEVREVVQRCEVVELVPLGRHVGEYVAHKIARAGGNAEEIFDVSALDAIRAKLTRTARGAKQQEVSSICYPLVVNNLVARAMNYAALIGARKITEEIIMESA
ncbi:hypothetical protein EGT07_08025 [Herbaspirillum sp. HC18]|nr:hypothetical protein EGT07_08025 [Herbaspirillum sp. HC18]